MRGAFYITLTVHVSVSPQLHAYPTRLDCYIILYVRGVGATVLVMIAFAMSRFTGRSKYIVLF